MVFHRLLLYTIFIETKLIALETLYMYKHNILL